MGVQKQSPEHVRTALRDHRDRDFEFLEAMASSLLHCSDKLPFMNVETVLHMKEGLGETSYAQNSSLQASTFASLPLMAIDSFLSVHAFFPSSGSEPWRGHSCRGGAWTR
jgi:hypothetical protein